MPPKKEDNSAQGNAARARIAEQQRQNRRNWRGHVDAADWGAVDANELLRVVECVTGKGHAIQFSYTRDGGSFVVRIVGDGEPHNEYVRPSEDISLYFQFLIDKYGK